MIKVTLIKKDQEIIGLKISGHADYAECGQDLVCAAASAIVTGGFNALRDDEIKVIHLAEGDAYVEVNNTNNETLRTMLIQLKTLEEAYPQYIKIK